MHGCQSHVSIFSAHIYYVAFAPMILLHKIVICAEIKGLSIHFELPGLVEGINNLLPLQANCHLKR